MFSCVSLKKKNQLMIRKRPGDAFPNQQNAQHTVY